MGSEYYEDSKPKEVTISKGFWISKYEITKYQGNRVLGLSSARISGNRSSKSDINTPIIFQDRDRLIEAIRKHELYSKSLGRKLHL